MSNKIMSVTVARRGSNTEDSLKKMQRLSFRQLTKYGDRGVMALASATPIETGKTAASWGYEITSGENTVSLIWTNTNIPRNVPVAILIQYGHGMPNGTFVEGIDYINPALRPIFEDIANEIWNEVTSYK